MDMTEVIRQIAERVPDNGATYVDETDGLRHCTKCRGARQTRITVGGLEMVVPAICQCMQDAIDRDYEERQQQEKAAQIRRYRKLGFPDREMMHCTFASDDGKNERMSKAMRAYVRHFPEFRHDGKGLMLYGDVGTGKSFYAACIVNALIDQGYPCLMTNFSRLTNAISETWEKQEYIDSLTRFALIAIDDLGVERDTSYMNESVTTIIDALYRAKVPIIVTSNHEPKALLEEPEIRRARVYDRLLERCHPVKVDGVSRRKTAGRKDYKDMNHILGL